MQSVRVVEAVSKHSATVIFLHGLGDQGTSFIPLAKAIQRHHPHIKFVLPTAAMLPIKLNGGFKMPAWFDINTLDKLTNSEHDDERGMLTSVSQVNSLIEAETATIPSDRVVVGGFSQGCVVATLTALRSKRRLGGVISLSGWLPLSHKIEEMIDSGAKDLPFFWGHGSDDRVVSYEYGKKSISLLQSLPSLNLPLLPKGTTFARPGIRFETYQGMQHELCGEEVSDLVGWLGGCLPPV